mgnify:CR=1 FL=1
MAPIDFMAGGRTDLAWIESHDTIWEHHKVAKLCQLLKIGKPQAVGHLHAIWHFTLRNAWRNANLESWGDAEIERGAMWEGEKYALVKALREVCFLDGFIVHDWKERARGLIRERLYNEQRRKKTVKTKLNPSRVHPKVSTQVTPSSDSFELFWAIYPRQRHVNKLKAHKVWEKIKDIPSIDVLRKAIESQRQALKWDEKPEYIPHASTWLNGKRWEDDNSTAMPNQNHGDSRYLEAEILTRQRAEKENIASKGN